MYLFFNQFYTEYLKFKYLLSYLLIIWHLFSIILPRYYEYEFLLKQVTGSQVALYGK